MDRESLSLEITAAMRARDKLRLSILRQVKNELDMREKESGRQVEPAEVVAALKKVLKQTSETLEGSIKVDTDAERTAHLTEQVAILEAYLPAQVEGDALRAVVTRVLDGAQITEKRDMGRAIGAVVAECGGNCDKAEVARLVGEVLS
ncbi:MAG: GatB/YqeY domain-containing protein [Coriobacteriia bacterium]|nr:GatB/YqeY domain-containing protein [Actinomycetota bacterium]MDZ4166648.1 GatB/YqeY domain-containing protein [Coriobacteriia bacterium]